MGVPGIFAWLLKKYNTNILLSCLPNEVKYLYIDANCLFHPKCNEIITLYPEINDEVILEKLIFDNIIKYLNFIEEFVNPQIMMFISVDGVAPAAKLIQQRKRRFKSVLESDERNKLKDKYNIQYNKIWNSNVITPGTEFMERLHIKLINYYKNKEKKIKYIYSSYHSFGEGEHKILQHIKYNTDINDNIVIYGLDADLIFLALASEREHIYLLRENIMNDNKLIYLSILNTKISYLTELQKSLKNKELNKQRLINDYIFICFLLGNDFLPHIPSITIYNRGLELLIKFYIEIINEMGEYLLDNTFINNNFLLKYIYKLSLCEEYYLKNNQLKNKKECIVDDEYMKELWEFENLKNIENNDDLKLFEPNFKSRYYKYYFNNNDDIWIQLICEKYIQGLKWNIEYYFDKCYDYRWYYTFNNAPLITDIYKYLKNKNINNIKFDNIECVSIMTQLFTVLPPKSNNLLPNKYKKLINHPDIKYLYPDNIKLDYLHKIYYWQCQPILPYLNLKKIINVCEKIIMNKEENKRNLQLDNIFF